MILLLAILLGMGCREDNPFPGTGPDLLRVPPGFPPIEFPEENAFTEERWELGKKLFFDPVLSRNRDVSCGSCHHPELAFADDRALSPGVEGRPGVRNAPSLANVGFHPYLLREGSLPTLEMQVLVPLQEHNELDHNIVDLSQLLQQDPEYVAMSQEAYGRVPDPFVITRALSTYQRTLISGNSPFDQFRYQDRPEALNPAQIRGMELFFSEKTDCGQCHGGFNFTSYAFENNGLDTLYDDPGRMRFTNDPADESLFKVPSLRNVALTAPYMHDGSLPSLEAVLRHYNAGGHPHFNKSPLVRPLNLSQQELSDLQSFLEALSDTEFVNDSRWE